MKNSQEKVFIAPLLLAIIAVLAIGGGVYIYNNKKVEVPIVDTETQQTTKVDIVTEKASGIIKSVYTKSGKNYIDIDYVEFNPDWIPGGNTGSVYTNTNPQIRTFEISTDAKFFKFGDASISFSDFYRYFITDSYQRGNPWDIVITNGVITKITEHFVS